MVRKLLFIIFCLCLGFTSKVEAADVSQLSNTIYADAITVQPGSSVVLSIKMKNLVPMTGFQFDLDLPNGMTVQKDEDDFLKIDLSPERTTSKKTDYFNSAEQADGLIRVMCSSTRSYTFSGNDGEVCTITLDIDKNLSEGQYFILLKNIALSDENANSKDYKVSEIGVPVTIGSPQANPFDLNKDGKVDVSDVTTLVNYIITQ